MVIMMITDKVCACVQSQSKQSYHSTRLYTNHLLTQWSLERKIAMKKKLLVIIR